MNRVKVDVTRDNYIKGYEHGIQMKWLKDDMYIKLNSSSTNEDISEVFVSQFLGYTNIENYVSYYGCSIYEDGKFLGNGCYSKNFLKSHEECISLYDFMGKFHIPYDMIGFGELVKRLKGIIDSDVGFVLNSCICIDSISLNFDRHFRNILVIRDKLSGSYRLAPLLDFGDSLFSDREYYDEDSMDKNSKMSYTRPFANTFEEQLVYCRVNPIKVDVKRLKEGFIKPDNKDEEYALSVLKYGLERFKDVAWVEG